MNDNNDKHDGINPQGTRSPNGDPGHSDGPPTNNHEHATNEPDRGRDEIAGEASGKRPVSARKIEANRRNSRKSTGPTTAAGKKRVSKNAIRHGFYSKCLLVQHRDGREDRSEYDGHYLGIRRHYQPVGGIPGRRDRSVFLASSQTSTLGKRHDCESSCHKQLQSPGIKNIESRRTRGRTIEQP